jgi:hypothetical protein
MAGEELFGISGLSITSAGSVRIVTGGNGPAYFEDALFNFDLGSVQASWVLSPSEACDFQDVTCVDAPVFNAVDQARTDVFVLAVLEGYLFEDQNSDLLRNGGDTIITNAEVRLVVNGVVTNTVYTDATGYYKFLDVPTGLVSILVSRAGAELIAVPDQEPYASDPSRNRALPDIDGVYAVIEYQVTSGYGVLAGNPSETLNFGFSTHPLSTRIDLQVYAVADGSVLIELATADENGNQAIEIYALIDDEWHLTALIPSEQIVGSRSNVYTVEADGLIAGVAYRFKIKDESGHIFEPRQPILVALNRLRALTTTLEPKFFTVSFQTDPGQWYVIKVSESPFAGAGWTSEFVQIVHPAFAGGLSEFRQVIQGAPEGATTVRIPRSRKRAFFKIVEIER